MKEVIIVNRLSRSNSVRLMIFGLLLGVGLTLGDWPPSYSVVMRAAAMPNATMVTLLASEDATVAQSSPTTNFGAAETLIVSHDEFIQERLALLKFDIANIPAEATINSAKLQLDRISTTFPVAMDIQVQRVQANWSEGTVIWNTRPTLSATVIDSITAPASPPALTIEWDILSLVQGWHNNTFSNQGLALINPTIDNNDHIFASSEAASTITRPPLVIDYTLPTATPTGTLTPSATPTSTSTPTSTFTPTPTISPTAIPSSGFNVQIQAIEVTQGIHGNIPFRVPPAGGGILDENATHVANRRTIVRIYPWISGIPAGSFSPPLTAQLYSSRSPGEPLTPITPLLRVNPGWSLSDMRADATKSWNFVLPSTWDDVGAMDLTAVVNPSGSFHQDECTGCAGDNLLFLRNVRFTTVQNRAIRVPVYLADFYERDDSGTVIHNAATLADLIRVLDYWRKTWPIADGTIRLGLVRLPRISDAFAVPPITDPPAWDNQVFMDEIAPLLPPPGVTDPYLYVPLIFSPSTRLVGCGGVAGIGYPPLFHTGACGSTFAQEAAHSIGRNHASNAHGESGGGPVDPSYPGPHGEIGANAYGFDIYDIRAIPPTQGSTHTHDFMSYGGEPRWVSPYTWDNLANIFGAAAIDPGPTSLEATANVQSQMSDYLRVSGQIIINGATTVDPAFFLSLPTDSHNYEGQGTYELELRNALDQTLFLRRFEPQAHTHESQDELHFYELVPVVQGFTQLVILKNKTILATVLVSPNPPQVSLVSPIAGENWPATGEKVVSWQGSDPDGDPLTFRIEASPDGQTWFVLIGDTTQTQATLDLTTIPGGGPNWRVRVRASDGLNTTAAEVNPINIAPKPPQPLIFHPLDNSVFAFGQSIPLEGQANDWQDGDLPASALTWLVDGQVVGSGEQVDVANLALGQHQVQLQAKNNAGLVGTMEVVITISGHNVYLPLILK